jgi:hypothetical protein
METSGKSGKSGIDHVIINKFGIRRNLTRVGLKAVSNRPIVNPRSWNFPP